MKGPEKRSAARVFADTALAARFWFLVAVLLAVVCVAQPIVLKVLEITKPREKIVVLDNAGNVIISRYEDLFGNKRMVEEIALQSVHCLLTLNAEGMEQKEFLVRLFSASAAKQAEEVVERIREKFPQDFRFFQSVKVFQIKSRTNRDHILVRIEGQAVRTGEFPDGQSFRYEEPLVLRLQLVKNADMMDGKRWPLIVDKFDLQWEQQTNA